MNTMVKFLEGNGFEDLEFAELVVGKGYVFFGYKNDQEVQITLTLGNTVLVDNLEEDIYVPFNVWGIEM